MHSVLVDNIHVTLLIGKFHLGNVLSATPFVVDIDH